MIKQQELASQLYRTVCPIERFLDDPDCNSETKFIECVSVLTGIMCELQRIVNELQLSPRQKEPKKKWVRIYAGLHCRDNWEIARVGESWQISHGHRFGIPDESNSQSFATLREAKEHIELCDKLPPDTQTAL